MKYASNEKRNKSARRVTQFVPIGMPTVEKTPPPNIRTMLYTCSDHSYSLSIAPSDDKQSYIPGVSPRRVPCIYTPGFYRG